MRMNEPIDIEKMHQEKEYFERLKRERQTRQTILESELNKNNFDLMPVEKKVESIMLHYTSDKGRNYLEQLRKYVDKKFYETNITKFQRLIKDTEELEKSSNYYEFVDKYRKEKSSIIDAFIENIKPELKTINEEFETVKETLNSTSPLVQNITQTTYENSESKRL